MGFVKSINGDLANVVFPRKSGCGGNCGGCTGGCASSSETIEIKNTLNVSVGTRVQVGIKKSIFSKMIFWAYIFPTIMFAIGLTAGLTFFKSSGYGNYELLGAFTGFILLGISYFLSGKIDKKVSKNNEYEFQMLKIVK
ncbi:SoxR reducing system RseC family protein [Oceanirhabdus sp. W0125-5]|uniref:SoxR reducing system RseC family protein n=1 Tax=Oceanirhabdus sp. W0125-5 TaxID=2999116 RepID=UPI0022F2E603|nr:SoxR reducing system RseC family protein [Oceanirhabdus sp. W0125-5]WBW99819.1 SoxR reducing system RseC family protein [Oceanirhabdus sp. W0125-5]